MSSIALFLAGMATGIAFMGWHDHSKCAAVRKVAARKNAEIGELRTENELLKQEQENANVASAYRKGKSDKAQGSGRAISPAEAFAQEWQDQKQVTFINTTRRSAESA